MLVSALDTTAKTASCAVLEKDADGERMRDFYIRFHDFFLSDSRHAEFVYYDIYYTIAFRAGQ